MPKAIPFHTMVQMAVWRVVDIARRSMGLARTPRSGGVGACVNAMPAWGWVGCKVWRLGVVLLE